MLWSEGAAVQLFVILHAFCCTLFAAHGLMALLDARTAQSCIGRISRGLGFQVSRKAQTQTIPDTRLLQLSGSCEVVLHSPKKAGPRLAWQQPDLTSQRRLGLSAAPFSDTSARSSSANLGFTRS